MPYDEALVAERAVECFARYYVPLGSGAQSCAAIVVALEECGVPIYACGGTVRDLVLGVEPNDIDLIAGADIQTVAATAERLYGAGSLSIRNEALGLIRLGDTENYVDINIFRDIASADHATSLAQVSWRYGGSPASDALTTDFTVNAMYWRSSDGIIDPLGGLEHCRSRTLVISASTHKASIDPKLALRMARFACLGYQPDGNAVTFFRARVDGDVGRYGAVLPSYLHELTRGSDEVKAGIIAFATRYGASARTIELLSAATRDKSINEAPYAATNLASPLAT